MRYLYGLIVHHGTDNIGDDIQSLAAKQFLPQVDVYLDREHLNEVRSDGKIKVIMNGWFMRDPRNWPPSDAIDPLFISFHISPKSANKLTSSKSIKYFKKYEPIGCRDYYTLGLLRRKGVNAYFSGCLTLTLTSKTRRRSNEILLVDLHMKALKVIPLRILKSSTIITHYPSSLANKLAIIEQTIAMFTKTKFPPLYNLLRNSPWIPSRSLSTFKSQKISISKRLMIAERILKRYSKAKLVVTSRLHVALPCLAFNTPVIFVHWNLKDPRISPYLRYLNAYSLKEFKSKIHEIDWDNPKPNPNPNGIYKLRENLVKTVKKFIYNSY